jgi:hypothetical protein
VQSNVPNLYIYAKTAKNTRKSKEQKLYWSGSSIGKYKTTIIIQGSENAKQVEY